MTNDELLDALLADFEDSDVRHLSWTLAVLGEDPEFWRAVSARLIQSSETPFERVRWLPISDRMCIYTCERLTYDVRFIAAGPTADWC